MHLPPCSCCPSGQKHPGEHRREKHPKSGGHVGRQIGPHSLYSIPTGQVGVGGDGGVVESIARREVEREKVIN